jgi:hypothetical protein
MRYIHLIGGISQADINKALSKPTLILAVTTIHIRVDDPTNVDDDNVVAI